MLLYGEICKASYSPDHWREQIIKSQPKFKPKLESMSVIYTCTHILCAFQSIFNTNLKTCCSLLSRYARQTRFTLKAKKTKDAVKKDMMKYINSISPIVSYWVSND